MLKTSFKLLMILIFLTGCTNSDSADDTTPLDILQRLKQLQGVDVTEITPSKGYSRGFQIDFTQPVNHSDKSGGTFRQRAYLYHNGDNLPVIMNTAGYLTSPYVYGELPKMFGNNYITVTHRYFTNAEPSPKDWKHLTVKQSADDLHEIREKLKDIYKGKWLTTGGSKGGMTALFYRYFHRNDIDATVAYVAPIMTGLPDNRFTDYLQNRAADKATVDKIKSFQLEVLNRRSEMIEKIKSDSSLSTKSFSSLGYDAALELAVLEYWFYFFQYGEADPASIPSATASTDELFSHLQSTSSVSYYTDNEYTTYMPFYYQAFTELGYYYFIDDHLKDKLIAIKDSSHKILTPPDETLTYSPALMNQVLAWLKTEGNNIIYIYGGADPYTQAPADPGTTNSLLYIIPGADHYANITKLPPDQKEQVLKTLENWMGVTIDRNYASGRKAEELNMPDYRRRSVQ